MHIGMQHLYKNKLQNFAQKKNLTLPVYTCERDGPPHASRFRCKVEIDGKTYESPEFHATLKDAENAVAKVALLSSCQDGVQEASIPIQTNFLDVVLCLNEVPLSVTSTNFWMFISFINYRTLAFTKICCKRWPKKKV